MRLEANCATDLLHESPYETHPAPFGFHLNEAKAIIGN